MSIHLEVDFEASPSRIFESLLDEVQFAALTGRPATIDRAPGGAFSVFGGMISGRNVELVPDQLIAQAWRVSAWPPGVYSMVRFELRAKGTGTGLVFDHTGYPEEHHDHLAAGWVTNYWQPLRQLAG